MTVPPQNSGLPNWKLAEGRGGELLVPASEQPKGRDVVHTEMETCHTFRGTCVICLKDLPLESAERCCRISKRC